MEKEKKLRFIRCTNAHQIENNHDKITDFHVMTKPVKAYNVEMVFVFHFFFYHSQRVILVALFFFSRCCEILRFTLARDNLCSNESSALDFLFHQSVVYLSTRSCTFDRFTAPTYALKKKVKILFNSDERVLENWIFEKNSICHDISAHLNFQSLLKWKISHIQKFHCFYHFRVLFLLNYFF